MDALPDELLCALFVHLPCPVLRSTVPLVCRRWHNVSGDAVALGKRTACIDTAQTMKRPSRWCDAAAAAGHLNCLAYARYKLGLPWGAKTCQAAAREGRVDCLMLAHRNGCPWNSDTTRVAAANGHLDCFLYARKEGCETPRVCALAAVRNGHAAIFDAIITSADGNHALDAQMCERAAIGGHLRLVQRICVSGAVPGAHALHYAVRAGNTSIVRYFVEEHGMYARWTLDSAIQSGSLETVRFLCESFGLGSVGNIYAAACERRRKIVVYLLGRVTAVAGFTGVDHWTTEKIIRHGWVDAVRLLCAPGAHMADFVAAASVDSDRIRCLECALDCGAALDPDLVVRAARRGRVAMIDLLVRRGLAWSADAMHAAAQNGHVEALSRAKLAGVAFDADACALAAKHGHEETVRYLCNQKCRVDGRARALAEAYWHHAIERYLADRGYPWDEDEYRRLVVLLRGSRTFVINDAPALF
ncbi:Ankyrin repeat domain containing protein [Pandoravirus salinus]|uniref:Ankyrin repeat domain containing protein n=1 Tax=Pandoravirus salinus TaxID=1349410 RepID=S4VVU1_9VIRU|nr:ankyrin repeat domain [Pandoravirus salinus]AGO84769.1 Ankyrin repeat domain containing protein [Pandoravirus salinus]